MKASSKYIGRMALAAALAVSTAAFAEDDVQVVSRVQPQFPHEAAAIGADSGHVRARVTIDQSGEVTHVEIIEANPRRVFDRAVTRALAQWHFNPGKDGRLYVVNVDFDPR
jgi:periplasmic protein TonB